MFCSDPMSDSHLIAQTSKFVLIDATVVTFGQGHGKVIEYIFLDPYILCAKYLRFSSNGFDVRGKSCCGSGRGCDRNELKTLGWLNYLPRPDDVLNGWGDHKKSCNTSGVSIYEKPNTKMYDAQMQYFQSESLFRRGQNALKPLLIAHRPKACWNGMG